MNGLRAIRTGLIDTVQVIYNIFDQNPEDELFPLCREMNIGVIARVPLDEGSLSGHFTAAPTFRRNMPCRNCCSAWCRPRSGPRPSSTK